MLAIYFPHRVCMMFGCPKDKKFFWGGLERAGLKRAGQGWGGMEERYSERSEQIFFFGPPHFFVPLSRGDQKSNNDLRRNNRYLNKQILDNLNQERKQPINHRAKPIVLVLVLQLTIDVQWQQTNIFRQEQRHSSLRTEDRTCGRSEQRKYFGPPPHPTLWGTKK